MHEYCDYCNEYIAGKLFENAFKALIRKHFLGIFSIVQNTLQ